MKIKSFFEKHKIFLSLCFFIIAITLFLSLTTRIDSDFFWHIKAGEYIFKNGILREDIFSWFVNGKYWMSHEWLFEVIIYVLKLLFSKSYMLIYVGVCLLSLLLILFLGNKDDYLKNIPFTLFWIILSFILVVFLQVRPHLLSFIFVAITIWFCYELYRNENSKKIYFLPIISILWSNIHGGSSNLSYLFCLIFFISGLFSFKFSKIEAVKINKRQIKKYLLVMFLCMIGVCINVHGFKMFTYPYLNMLDTVMLNNIAEWQPTTLSNPQHYLYFVLLLIIVFIMLFSKKKILFIDFILLGVSAFLGLKSIRFWGYTYVIMSFVIFNYVEKKKYDKGTCFGICLISIILIFFFAANTKVVYSNFNERRLSSNIVSIIKKEKPNRLYNMYDYGGELIYNDILVFIDGRADLYSKYNYEDYLDISMLQGDYVELITKYNFDYFLVDIDYPINTYLKYSDEYKEICSEEGIILYKKRG